MADRTTPYPAFNFVINIGTGEAFGGFSNVTGLETDITISPYRNGNEKLNQVRKIQGLNNVGDVTLTRGVIKSTDMWAWIQDARIKGPAAKREVSIVLRDESGQAVQTWNLHNVVPLKYTGPALAAAKGDVATEQLVLSAEGIDLAV